MKTTQTPKARSLVGLFVHDSAMGQSGLIVRLMPNGNALLMDGDGNLWSNPVDALDLPAADSTFGKLAPTIAEALHVLVTVPA